MGEIALIRRGVESAEFDKRLEDAFSVHYFWGRVVVDGGGGE